MPFRPRAGAFEKTTFSRFGKSGIAAAANGTFVRGAPRVHTVRHALREGSRIDRALSVLTPVIERRLASEHRCGR